MSLSTYLGHTLTDELHSAVFYSLGLNEAVFKDFGNEFAITQEDETGILTVGTGGGMSGARICETTESKQFAVSKGYWFVICLEYDGMAATGEVVMLSDAFSLPELKQDNIQKNPQGTYQYKLYSGKRETDGNFYDLFDNRSVIDLGGLIDQIKTLEEEQKEVNQRLEITTVRGRGGATIAIGKTFDMGLTKEEAVGKTFMGSIMGSNGSHVNAVCTGTYMPELGAGLNMQGAYPSGTNTQAYVLLELRPSSGTTWIVSAANVNYSYSANIVVGSMASLYYKG